LTLRAVLVGAGHAHLQLIAGAAVLRRSGVAPLLISPAIFRYSGLASGVLSGAVAPHEAEIDVAALAAHHGVEHLVAEAQAVDLGSRTIHTTTGERVGYEALSLNAGSVVGASDGFADQQGVWPVKPLAKLFALRRYLEAAFAAGRRCPALLVAGRGPTGYEIAAALAGLCERHGVAPRLTLVGPPHATAWAPPLAVQRLDGLLAKRGVTVVADRVGSIDAGVCALAGGRTVPFDALVLATGLAAPPLVAALSLPIDGDGRLVTTPTLQSMADATVFGTGDCATIGSAPRPFAGIFGVRAAAVLAGNLTALARSAPLEPFRPQTRWLWIMDLGNGSGLAIRGDRWWFGRPALALKRWIDRRFIARYRR
jgi:selenide,water dikinase